MYKPAFFEALGGMREAGEAVADVREWMGSDVGRSGSSQTDVLSDKDDNLVQLGRNWTTDEVVLELGGVLKALSFSSSFKTHSPTSQRDAPPSNHFLFSKLKFIPSSGMNGDVLEDCDDFHEDNAAATSGELNSSQFAPSGSRVSGRRRKSVESDSVDDGGNGTWLDEDDIENC